MKHTTLEQLAHELELHVDLYEQVKEGIKCPRCKKAQVTEDRLLALKHLGICINCDHVRGDVHGEEGGE